LLVATDIGISVHRYLLYRTEVTYINGMFLKSSDAFSAAFKSVDSAIMLLDDCVFEVFGDRSWPCRQPDFIARPMGGRKIGRVCCINLDGV
jgi:hypothetical protein